MIKIQVSLERFEEIVSIEDSMNFMELSRKEAYDYLVQFVVNEQGEPLPVSEARALFKKVPRKELDDYIMKFLKAVGDAFVNPPNGAA